MIGPVTTSDEFDTSAGAGDAAGIGEGTGALAGAEAADAAFVVDGAIARSSLHPHASANAATATAKSRWDVLAKLILTNPSNPKSST
jgi:hypothetical protein